MNIYLIGFMGSGKSHTGKQVADALGIPFVDLDDRIEAQAGCSIAQLFEYKGETYFRALEATALRATLTDDPAVISCGGGTPCFHDNMDWIKNNGLSIYLKASVPLLVKRLQKGQEHRPLIRGLNETELAAFIAERVAQREFFYGQAQYILSQEDNQSLLPQILAIYQEAV